MTNFRAKAMNSIAKVTNSIAKVTNSIAKVTNSIAKTCKSGFVETIILQLALVMCDNDF